LKAGAIESKLTTEELVSRVFLSHARQDVDAAKSLAESISRAGHDVWWDRQLQAGSRFAAEIDHQLKQAQAVVVLWTAASVESAWVQDEAVEGRDSGTLVPVALNSIKPPLGFRQFHTIDLSFNHGKPATEGLDQVLAAIGRLCEGDLPGDTLQSRPIRSSLETASVCVLPFINMSGEPEQEYFSDGITEDIITDLSKVSALSVVPRNTAFRFKAQLVDTKELADKLGVTHILEGSVRKAGNRLRISAQLIDGKADDHLWADRFDREITDIFAIQDEISKAIVDALQVRLRPHEKTAIETRGTTSVDAYDLYLMGRQQWIGGTFGDIRRAKAIVRFCRQATRLDAAYAEAWALMALAQAELHFWHGKEENALPAAEKALKIKPQLAEAHCVRARYLEENDEQEAANAEMQQALSLNPQSWEVNREAGRMLFRHKHVRESIPLLEKAVSLMDTDWQDAALLITCYKSTGDEAGLRKAARRALERAEREVASDPTNAAALAMGTVPLAILGDQSRARDWVRRALLLDPENLSLRYYLACALSALADVSGAIKILQPYFERVRGRAQLRHLEVDDDLAALREDPRFEPMLASAKQRLGMT
jgi:adenylate cyclase